MNDTFDELRIIAADARLASPDRAVLVRAADEFEQACKIIIALQTQLIESQARRIATNDQLIAARRDILSMRNAAPMFPSLHLTISGHLVPSPMFQGA